MSKKVINKGYTLEITSWENDADNYKTKKKTVDTKEEAEKLYKICTELFRSKNNGNNGVGNSMNKERLGRLLEYVEVNYKSFPELKLSNSDDIFDYFSDLAYELMGNSEYYDFRVCESCSITYSPNDVYLDEVKF